MNPPPPVMYSIPGFSEPVCSISHLLAAGLFSILGVFLLRHGRGDRIRVLSLGVFVFSAVFMFFISGIYHLTEPGSDRREVFQRLDHAAIFVLIAGTVTALHTILFQHIRRWGMVALIWCLAAIGIIVKNVFFYEMSESIGLALYLGMGGVGVASWAMIIHVYSWREFQLMFWGGFIYSVGGVLDFLRWPILIPGVVESHDLFHVAVIVALGLHWHSIHRSTHHLSSRTLGVDPKVASEY